MTKRKLSNIQKNFTAVIYRTALKCDFTAKGDSGGIQTRDLRNRNPAFYSAELRSHNVGANIIKKVDTDKSCLLIFLFSVL